MSVSGSLVAWGGLDPVVIRLLEAPCTDSSFEPPRAFKEHSDSSNRGWIYFFVHWRRALFRYFFVPIPGQSRQGRRVYGQRPGSLSRSRPGYMGSA